MAGISVVICGANEFAVERVERMYRERLGIEVLEIHRVSDLAGMAAGLNRGLAESRGDYVIFSGTGVEFMAEDLGGTVVGHMGECDVLGVAGTRVLTAPGWRMAGPPWLYGQVAYPSEQRRGEFDVTYWTVAARRVGGMQALDGVFLCARREAAERVGFDEENFRGRFMWDVDFTYRAFLAGMRLAVASDLYPVDHEPVGYTREWIPQAQVFLKKFSGRLAVRAAPNFQSTVSSAESRAEVVRLMTPLHWGDMEDWSVRTQGTEEKT